MSKTPKIEKENFSYGFELELSDVDRRIDIPPLLGSWEGPKQGEYHMGSEFDIVNTLGLNEGHASDPLCIDCKVGGEINVAPTNTVKGQFNRILEIFHLFPLVRSGHVNHFHVHVHVPGLRDDLEKLKNMAKWAEKNQDLLMRTTYNQNFFESVGEHYDDLTEYGREYLYADGCRLINPEAFRKVEAAKTPQEAIDAFNTPAVIKLKGEEIIKTSVRTGINFSNLLQKDEDRPAGKTIEYRCFRSTTKPYEIFSELMLVKRITEESVLPNGKDLEDILKEGNYSFAPLTYNHQHQVGWIDTQFKRGYGDFKYFFPQFREPNDDVNIDFTDIWDVMVERFNEEGENE